MTMSYVSRSDLIFRSHFIIFIPRIEIEDSEAVGISNIISNLITMFPRSTLTALPSDLFILHQLPHASHLLVWTQCRPRGGGE